MKEQFVLRPDEQDFEFLISGLIERGYGSLDGFFSPETVRGLRENLLRHFCKGNMQPAGVGRKFDYARNTTVRGDVIKWLEPDSPDPFEQAFFHKLEPFIQYLNATCFTGINGYEFHYAFYETGSFYKRHLDQFKSDKGRMFSFVLYLNEDWSEEEGGKLSLYLPGEEVSLYPTEGRVVFFRSSETEHEVHPSHQRPRLSIAGWLKKLD